MITGAKKVSVGAADIRVDESTDICAPQQRVWDAIVDAEYRAHWWSYLTLDPRPGGRFEERWTSAAGEPRRTSGCVTGLVEPTMLSLTWTDDDWLAVTHVEIRLQQDDSVSTTVRVRHTGWELLHDGGRLAREHREGWKAHLGNLRAYLTE